MSATPFIIRPAVVGDAPAIGAVHCSNVKQWRRWEADGGARPARYADLGPYQRWLNGGPWMDADSCAHHLQRLFAAGGIALVAERRGRVLAEVELHVAEEPPPYGRNMNLAVLYVHRNHHGHGLGTALMRHALALAEAHQCHTFTVAHAEAPNFYARHGLRKESQWVRYRLPVGGGKIKYSAEPLPDAPYDLVRGWAMPIGRYQNALHDWERTRPGAVPDFVEWRGLRLERHWITVSRHRAALILEESPSAPGVANAFLFTPAHSTTDFLPAIRDLAALFGFTGLRCFTRADTHPPDAVATDYTHKLFLKRLR
ncbi:MAG: GNAT family N-acetyltransferase [Chloroflexi bacterium]|nr:GNAT family N-acetyltransferase [Chloroflexota bacterium]